MAESETRRGGRVRRVVGRLAVALAVAAPIALVVLAALTRTAAFNEWLRSRVEALVEVAPSCTFRIDRVEGWVGSELVLEGIELRCREEPIARVRGLRVVPDLAALLRGTLRVRRLEVAEPWLRLERDGAGRWNLASALGADSPAEVAPAEKGRGLGLPLPLRVDAVRVTGGAARVSLPERPDLQIDALTLNAELRARGRTLRTEIEHLALGIAAGGLPPLHAEARGGFAVRAGSVAIRVEALALRTAHSRLGLEGELLPGERAALELRLEPLASEDLHALGIPLAAAVSGSARVEGPWRSVGIDADLASGGAELRAALKLDLAEPGLRNLQGTLRLRDADLTSLVEGLPLAGVLDATATLEGGRADLRAELTAGEGTASLDGELVGLAGTPEYRFHLALARIDPVAVLPQQPRLGGVLTLDAEVSGRGFSSDTLEGTALLALAPSRLGAFAVREGEIRLRAAAGRVDVERFELDADHTNLSLTGRVGLRPAAPLDLQLAAEVRDASPLLALFGLEGGGRLGLRARAQGTASSARVEADADLAAVRLPGFSAASGSLEVAVEGLGAAAPQGEARLRLAEIAEPVALASLTAELRGRGVPVQALVVRVDAASPDGTAHELALDAERRGEVVALGLRELSLGLPAGRWRLVEPAELTLHGGTLSTPGLRARSGASSLALAGTLGRSGEQSFHAELLALPVAALATSLPGEVAAEGNLDLRVDVEGTAAEPQLAATLRVEKAVLAETPLAGLEATLDYRLRTARLDLALRQDAVHVLTARGSLPVALGWAEALEARIVGDVDLRARSDGIDLGFANAFSGAFARDIGGELTLDVAVSGPVSAPDLRGEAKLRGAAITPFVSNVPLREIDADLRLRPDAVQIDSLTAAAGEGRLEARGTLGLRAGRPHSLEAAIDLREWQLIATRSYRLRANAGLRAKGELSALEVAGDVTVLEGTLRPDLDFLREEPPERDPTIERARAPGSEPSAPASREAASPPFAQTSLYRDLALDVDVRIERNLWVQHDQASIELSGELHLEKERGEDPSLVGRIETVRGWAELWGRRFRLVEGSVTFTGGSVLDLDPGLDVRARYHVPDYTVDAIVGGTLHAPTSRLESEPELEQADILAVLLFGRPVSELSEGEQATLGESATSAATRYGITAVSRTVAEELGLGEAGIQIEELSTERARVGTYVSERAFVSVTQEFGVEAGWAVSVEYEFWPGWSIVTETNSLQESAGGLRWKMRY